MEKYRPMRFSDFMKKVLNREPLPVQPKGAWAVNTNAVWQHNCLKAFTCALLTETDIPIVQTSKRKRETHSGADE